MFSIPTKKPKEFIQLISLIWDSFLTSCLFSNSCQNTQLCLTKEVRNESNGGCSLRMGKHDQSSGSTSGGFLFVSLLPLDPVSFFAFLETRSAINHKHTPPRKLTHPLGKGVHFERNVGNHLQKCLGRDM